MPNSPAATAREPLSLRPAETRLLRFDGFEIDAAARVLVRAGQPVPTRRQVFDLLLLLVQRRPHTVTRDELREAIWGREKVAASAIARAVLEARRAIGDTESEPRWIVNVHGVGYRFAGSPLDRADTIQRRKPSTPATRLHLQEAQAAYWGLHDEALTRFHAEKALAEAVRQGLNVEAGKALCWLGWLALEGGNPDAAAEHTRQALHLATREDHAVLLARARTVDAGLQLCVGALEQAARQLDAALPVLMRDAHAGHRHRCELLLAEVARHIGCDETAMHWCEASERTARGAGLGPQLARSHALRVALGLDAGDAHAQHGRHEHARAAWEQALLTAGVLLDTLPHGAQPLLQAACRLDRAQLLARLGQRSAARQSLADAASRIETPAQDDPPVALGLRMDLQLARVRLCLLEDDLPLAMQAVDEALETAAGARATGPWTPTLYRLAAEVAERSGQLALALRWTRAHHEACKLQHGDRARALVRLSRSRSEHESTDEALLEMRQRAVFLERMNAQLLQRLHRDPPRDQHSPAAGRSVA